MTAQVSDIFDIRYGHSLELNALAQTTPEKGVAFVSRKAGDNGISAYVEPIDDIEPGVAGEITCALSGNGVLTTCLQETPFYTGYHVAILTPKLVMSKAETLFYCLCIKSNRYRYSYGRQANKTLAELIVPSPKDVPSWVHKVSMDPFAEADAPLADHEIQLPSPAQWKEFSYSSLFDIKKGQRLTKEKMTTGATPFIGAIDSNNGYRQFVSASPNHQSIRSQLPTTVRLPKHFSNPHLIGRPMTSMCFIRSSICHYMSRCSYARSSDRRNFVSTMAENGILAE